ncbi:MAG: phosphatidate cytidylyltransferase [Rhodospirillales bacterium]|nr:phosphatidate cytidylyltransferase [Rhodospirillales bacterium]
MSEKTSRFPSSLGPRIVSAVILAPVVLVLVYFGGWPFTGLVGLVAVILALEWARMVGQHPAWLALGVVYIALACWALWRLRLDPEWGRMTLFWLLAVVWGADTGGFAFGMAFRGPKLAPAISPNKTWSGFMGGTLVAALGGWAMVTYMKGEAGLEIVLFSALIGVASQMGDLFESWIKRRFGVKDSGAIIPGHGGLFDRVDGLVAAALATALINIGFKSNVLAWL